MSWPGDISSLYAEGILERDSNMLPQPGDDVFQPNLNSIYEGNRHRTSVSSSSGSSICEPSSPSTAYLRRQSTSGYSVTGPDDEAGDAPWNLVAYHIPWGPGYEGYEAGTLPGPDGTCIFLRSPTPLKRQRTTQACDKCRERKAKCSGTRPTCGRCSERGFLCVYSAGQATENPGSPIKAQRKLSYSSSKEQLKTSIRNRIRRKSSQTDATTLYNKIHETLPRRHSQPATSAPVPITPIVSMIQDQHHIEGTHGAHNRLEYPPVEGEIDPRELLDILGSPDLSHQPLGLYTPSISALDTYRFPPPSIETAPSSEANCSLNIGIGSSTYADNGLSVQYPPSIPSEILWQIPEYCPQLVAKTHHPAQSFEAFRRDFQEANYPGILPQGNVNIHVHKTRAEVDDLGQGHQTGFFPYFASYGTNFGQ